MFNVSEYVSAKTGSVVFVRKDGNFYCSESYHEAHKKIFKTRATIEYIDLDKNYNTTRVDASVDETKKIITLQVPAEFGSANMLRVTYSCGGNLVGEEIGAIGGGSGAGSYVVRLPADTQIKIQTDGSVGFSIEELSFDDFADIVYSGGNVRIDLSAIDLSAMGMSDVNYAALTPTWWAFNPTVNCFIGQLAVVVGGAANSIYFWFLNGTWRPPTA